MKAPMIQRVSFLSASVGLLAVAGCSILPEAGVDPTRIYVLATPGGAAGAKATAPVITVRPIEVANYLRSRPMVVRRGANEIEYREFARWGESLELGIARVLREELIAQGTASAVQIAGSRREGLPHEFSLTIRVLACEGGSDGAVMFRAVWGLATTEAKPRQVGGGEFRPENLRWNAKSEATLAAQLSVAVSGLAQEIAGALRK